MYSGIFTVITAVEPHPNSDNGLKIVHIAGSQVISTVDYKVGDMACFFPEGGKFSNEFLYENSEYRYSSTTEASVRPNKEANKFGFFEESGRIRCIKLRGQVSEGYIAPLSSLEYTGFDFSTVHPGYLFTELNGRPICERYVSPAQQRLNENKDNKEKKIKRKLAWAPTFIEHFDTENFKYNYKRIPKDAQILITAKLHGTSGRTGNVLVRREREINWYQTLAIRLGQICNNIAFGINPFDKIFQALDLTTEEYETISGSRRVAFIDKIVDGYHKGNGFRERIHESLTGVLHKGETLYYEIVGYQAPNSPLFHHNVKKDGIGAEILKQYKSYMNGSKMEYSYNCDAELGEHQIWIYRITHTNPDGHQIDLSYPQRLARCSVLGLYHVPRLFYGTVDELTLGGKIDFLEIVNNLAEQPSKQFPEHISEGVCIEVTHPELMRTFKNKAFKFLYLEGLTKEDDNYIDIEEVS
jgi:hypothetical protein